MMLCDVSPHVERLEGSIFSSRMREVMRVTTRFAAEVVLLLGDDLGNRLQNHSTSNDVERKIAQALDALTYTPQSSSFLIAFALYWSLSSCTSSLLQLRAPLAFAEALGRHFLLRKVVLSTMRLDLPCVYQ